MRTTEEMLYELKLAYGLAVWGNAEAIEQNLEKFLTKEERQEGCALVEHDEDDEVLTAHELDLDEFYAWLDSCRDEDTDLDGFDHTMGYVLHRDLFDMLKSLNMLDNNDAKCMFAQEKYAEWEEYYENAD